MRLQLYPIIIIIALIIIKQYYYNKQTKAFIAQLNFHFIFSLIRRQFMLWFKKSISNFVRIYLF